MTIAFSLTRGGPFYRLLRRLGLARLDGRDVFRQSGAYLAIGWLPLQLLGFTDGSLLDVPWHALALHLRFFVAIPLLLASEALLEARCKCAIDGVATTELGPGAPAAVATCARAAERLRDSPRAELGLLALLVIVRVAFWSVTGKTVFVSDYGAVRASTALALWHDLVSLPLYNFLLLRWLWRWAIWIWLMSQISRVRLCLVPSHPDSAGGIARLADPSFAVALLIAGSSAVLATAWGSEIVFEHAELATFIVDCVLLVLLGESLALLPLLPFVPVLTRARFRGRDAYGRFALAYCRLFHERWVERGEREGLLGTPDISGLADLIASAQHVERMRFTQFRKEHALAVLACALVPMLPLPLMAAQVSVSAFLERTLMALLFGS